MSMREKKGSTVLVAIIWGLLCPMIANAQRTQEGGECKIWNGANTHAINWHRHDRTLLMGRRGHIAVNYYCGRPAVEIEPKFQDKLRPYVQLVRDGDVYVYRVHFRWLEKRMPDEALVAVNVNTDVRIFELKVNVVADSLEASLRASEAQRDVSGAYTEAEEANRRAEEAYRRAESVEEAGEKGVSIDFGGFRSVETAGKPGWGTSLTVSGVFHRFGGIWGLAAAGRLSWHVYELELIGVRLVNDDVNGQEFDLIGLFQLHLQPAWWFRAQIETGFGVRMFSHPDAVTVQDANLYIRGTEGRIDAYPLWACGAGLRFSPHRRLAFHLFYQMDLTLTRQVQHPSGDPQWDPQHAHIFNHKLGLGLSVEF